MLIILGTLTCYQLKVCNHSPDHSRPQIPDQLPATCPSQQSQYSSLATDVSQAYAPDQGQTLVLEIPRISSGRTTHHLPSEVCPTHSHGPEICRIQWP